MLKILNTVIFVFIISLNSCKSTTSESYATESVAEDEVDPDKNTCSKEDVINACKLMLSDGPISKENCPGVLAGLRMCGFIQCDDICSASDRPILCKIACEGYISNPKSNLGQKFVSETCKEARTLFKKFCVNIIKKMDQ